MKEEPPSSLEKIGNEVALYLKDKQIKEKKEVNDLVIATIRTTVPALVGSFVILLADRGITLDDATVAALGTALIGIVTAVYYVAVRLIAKKYPVAENLLGVAKKPVYIEPKKEL